MGEIDDQSKESNRFSVPVVIGAPKRVIDLIFDIWVWTFGAIISMLMGVLIDLSMVKEIVKMPIPVAIGFCTQYGCMPLVKKIDDFVIFIIVIFNFYLLN